MILIPKLTTVNQRFLARLLTTSARSPLALAPQEAAGLVKASAPGSVVFVDASWHMPGSPRNSIEEFKRKRLPGSRFFDLDVVASSHELGLKHMMPGGQVLATALQSLGVSPSTHVVFYDSVGVFSSPRALFTLRSFGHDNSSILDGGLLRWEAEGLGIESGTPQLPKSVSEYPAPEIQRDAIQSYEQIVTNTKLDFETDENARLVFDARSRRRFEGADPEPRPGLSSGHIPHSVSLPFNTFLRTNTISGSDNTFTTLLSRDEIIASIDNAVDKDLAQEILNGRRKITTTCGSGMTAAILWLGLKLVNPSIPVSLYDESWTGYAMRPESTIVKNNV